MPGFLAALMTKLAGLGTLTKAVVTAAAALTMTVAGGATGVLSLPGGQPDPRVAALEATSQTTAVANSATSSLPPTTSGEVVVQAATGATVMSTTSSSPAPSTGAATSTKASTAKLPAAPKVPNVVATIPALPALPSCVANLIPTGGTLPDPATLVAQLPACVLSVVSANLPLDTIKGVIGSANLPVDVSRCLSTVLSSVPAFVGGNLSGLPRLLAACIPAGSIPAMGSVPGMGSIPGMGSVPGMGPIPGFTGR